MASIDYNELLEALESRARSFGNEDLSGTFEDFLIKFDKELNEHLEIFTRQEAELDKQLAEAIKNGASKEVQNAIQNKKNNIQQRELDIIDKISKNNLDSVKSFTRSKAFENLSGYRGYEIFNKGKSFSKLSNSLEKIGLNKLGGAFGKIGSTLIKKAGPIGIALTVFDKAVSGATIAMNKIGEVYEYKANQQKFETQKDNTIHQRQLALTESTGQVAQAEQQNVITKAKNEIQRFVSLISEGISIISDAYASATEISIKSLTDIAGGAFEAASKSIDIETSTAKFNKHMELSGKVVAEQNKTADIQLASIKSNVEASNAVARTSATTQLAMLNQQQEQSKVNFVMKQVSDGVSMVPLVGDTLKGAADGAGNMVRGMQAYDNAMLEYSNQEKNYMATLNKAQVGIVTTLQNTAADFNAYATQTMTDVEQKIFDAEQEQFQREQKAWLNFSKTVFDSFQKSETAAFQMGRAYMFNEQQLNAYAKNLSSTQVTVSKWGKNLEDMMKMQISFQETTGRNRMISEYGFDKSFANSLLVGDDVVEQLNSGMEIFNASVADSNDMFYDMYKQVTKMGLSGKKYGKDLVNNLKLAEKYNFKNGVKSLMEMVKWSQNMRFNINSIDGMVDKVQTGGLEGIIKQSAELQVLGGNFAMGADPLAMAYESYMDPEAYAKRLNGMIAGQGVFNSETGEVSFGIASQMIMRQMAESTGQDYKDVLNQARQQVKINQINRYLGDNFNEDQQSLIANNATYDKSSQSWVIETANGKRSVSELTVDDLGSLVGTDDGEKTMQENIANMRSTAEVMKGTQDKIIATMQNSTWETNRESAIKMISNINKHFKEEFPTYTKNVKTWLENVPEKQQSMIDLMMGGEKSDLTEIKKTTQSLNDNLTNSIQSAALEITKAINNIEFPDAHSDSKLINDFIEHSNDKVWLRESMAKGTDAYNTMQELYNNFDKTYSALSEAAPENADYLRYLLAKWDPSGNKGDARISDVQLKNMKAKEAENAKKYDKQIKELYGSSNNFFGEGYTKYSVSDTPQTTVIPMGSSITGYTMAVPVNKSDDGIIAKNGSLNKINDGLVIQNGIPTRIDKDDQVLAAKQGGPIDKMLDMVQPRPMVYGSEVITKNGSLNKISNGLVIQNGIPTRIDKDDQVLAAKQGGPIDKMLDMVQPRPMVYDSYVKERPYNGSSNNNANGGKIEIAPIQISINGNIQVNGANGSIDLTQQISNDPNFIRALTQMISLEVEKKVNGGRVANPLNRNLQY